MPRVFLSLGTNHQRQENLGKALIQLQRHFSPLDLSPVYESEAIDAGGPHYFNLCLGFDTTLSLDNVRDIIQGIEIDLGRNRNDTKQVTIDIDLLLYGERVEQHADFSLPHPDISQYPHVLIPLLEIAPELILPGSGKTLRDQSMDLPTPESLRRVDLVPSSN